VRARGVVVPREVAEQAVQMPDAERPDPVQELSAQRSDEAFGVSIGSRAAERCAQWLDTEALDRLVDATEEDVVVVDQMTPAVIGGDRIAELLREPFSRGMLRRVEPQNAT
jgi:hypothetical protein